MRKPSTIRDVANLANVGVGTVSRYLKDSNAVKPTTQAIPTFAVSELKAVQTIGI